MDADSAYFNNYIFSAGYWRPNFFNVWQKIRISGYKQGATAGKSIEILFMFNLKNTSFEKNSYNGLPLLAGLPPLILGLLITITLLAIPKFLPPKLPLFYSLPWGDGQLATHQQFLVLPASIGAIAFLNLIISWQLHKQQSFFKTILFIQSLLVSLILTIAFGKIILTFI